MLTVRAGVPTTDRSVGTPVTIFVHIPKTGGATLRSIMLRNYRRSAVHRSGPGELPDVASWPETKRAAIRVFEGHMPFGLHAQLTEPATYFTLLRDPLERAISRYHYILERPEHSQHQKIKAYGSLRAFAVDAANDQTRILAGQRRSGAGCGADTLEQAKENLVRHFAVVGVTEQFDESLLLLKRTFGWRFVLYRRHNVTHSRPRQAELPAETVAVLEEHNRFDRELHAFARDLLAERVARQGPGFAIELEAFKRANERRDAPATSARAAG